MLLECNAIGYSTHFCTLNWIQYIFLYIKLDTVHIYIHFNSVFLGAFAKLRKSTVCFVMSVSLFAWNNSDPTARIFMKFDI